MLYDDRDASAGEKLVEAELLGCPLRVVAGQAQRSKAGSSRCRCGAGTQKRAVPLEERRDALRGLWDASCA